MSKKVISIVLSAAMLVAMLCVGVGAVTASADDTYTYYFLAPDNYFKAEAGASNTDVGVYWWQPEEVAAWPGITMTAAPEVGENVFKIEGVSPDTATVIFNAYVDAGSPADPALAAVAHQTVNINTEGYDADEEYEGCPECDNFNGMIYVLADDDEHRSVNDLSGAITTSGAWFTLDTYKNYDAYYGTYNLGGAAADTDSTPADTDSAPVADVKYHAGDEVTLTFSVGNVKVDGEAAFLGAYNYTITYDAAKAEFASSEDLTTGGMPVVNTKTAGTIKLATMAAEGLNEDFSGDKTAAVKVVLKVLADTDDLGVTGECTSLTAVVADKSSTKPLINKKNPEVDNAFTSLTTEVTKCVKADDTDSEEPPVESKPESQPESKPESKPESTVESKPESTVESKTESTVESKPSTTSSKTSSATSSTSSKKNTDDNASSKKTSSTSSTKSTTTTTTGTSTATVQTAGTFAVVSLVVILMAAAAVVLYTRKKTEE